MGTARKNKKDRQRHGWLRWQAIALAMAITATASRGQDAWNGRAATEDEAVPERDRAEVRYGDTTGDGSYVGRLAWTSTEGETTHPEHREAQPPKSPKHRAPDREGEAQLRSMVPTAERARKVGRKKASRENREPHREAEKSKGDGSRKRSRKRNGGRKRDRTAAGQEGREGRIHPTPPAEPSTPDVGTRGHERADARGRETSEPSGTGTQDQRGRVRAGKDAIGTIPSELSPQRNSHIATEASCTKRDARCNANTWKATAVPNQSNGSKRTTGGNEARHHSHAEPKGSSQCECGEEEDTRASQRASAYSPRCVLRRGQRETGIATTQGQRQGAQNNPCCRIGLETVQNREKTWSKGLRHDTHMGALEQGPQQSQDNMSPSPPADKKEEDMKEGSRTKGNAQSNEGRELWQQDVTTRSSSKHRETHRGHFAPHKTEETQAGCTETAEASEQYHQGPEVQKIKLDELISFAPQHQNGSRDIDNHTSRGQRSRLAYADLGGRDTKELQEILKMQHQHERNTKIPERLVMHKATIEELEKSTNYEEQKVQGYYIYTDGSSGVNAKNELAAGWAYAVVVQHEDGTTLEHFDRGQVISDPADPKWIGAEDKSSESAEIAAMQHAAIWLMHQRPQQQVTYRYDNNAVGNGAVGKWTVRESKADLLHLRAMNQLLEEMLQNKPKGEHVKAHANEPWNELVNSLAYSAMQWGHQENSKVPDLRQAIRGERPAMHWWWLHWSIEKGNPELPRIIGSTMVWMKHDQQPDITKSWIETEEMAQEKRQGQIRMMTYNVRTMNERTEGYDRYDGINTHAAIIRRQLTENGIQIAAFQETRARDSGLIESSDWIRLISKCDAGTGGTEIWLSKTNSIDEEKKVVFEKRAITVIEHNPEVIIARAGIDKKSLLIVSAHAPHSGNAESVIAEWWKQLSHRLDQIRGDDPLLLLVDANAHYDGENMPEIGGHQLERRPNKAAPHFLKLLKAQELTALNTHADVHRGSGSTWRHPKGTWHRNDYICVPAT